MIDFINPRSKQRPLTAVLGMLALVIFFSGAYLLYDNSHFVVAQKTPNIQTLPSGDQLLSGVDVAALQAQYNSPIGPEQEVDSDTPIELAVTKPVTVTETESIAAEVVFENTPSIFEEQQSLTEDMPTEVAVATTAEQQHIPQHNTLVIPKIGVNGTIHEGATEAVLWNGIWRLPMTSDNPEDGNMVLSAHRFLEQGGPDSFFYLDRMEVGDAFTVFWEGKEYNYQVREIKVIDPDEIEILHNTPNEQVILFTCTPLWTSKQRLVVIGDLL